MATHRFTVNVPNTTGRRASAQLRLEPAPFADLRPLALELPRARLKIVNTGITRDPCDCEGEQELALSIAAHSSIDVHVVVATEPPTATGGAMAAFNLIDVRRGKQVGGVLLACLERSGPERAGRVIPAKNPCPVVLAEDVYAVAVGGNPSIAPASKNIPPQRDLELVAPITNRTSRALEDVHVYLEHLGLSDAQFGPRTWNVGRLARNDVFFATWPLHTSASVGIFEASVVVGSRGKSPVRLSAAIEVGKGKRPVRRTSVRRR